MEFRDPMTKFHFSCGKFKAESLAKMQLRVRVCLVEKKAILESWGCKMKQMFFSMVYIQSYCKIQMLLYKLRGVTGIRDPTGRWASKKFLAPALAFTRVDKNTVHTNISPRTSIFLDYITRLVSLAHKVMK